MLNIRNPKLACTSLLAIGLATATLVAHAEPSVSGLTISWPDDGYYQVQRASDYITVCEGTRDCLVVAGEYTVINLTTAQRFEGVVVTDTGSEGGTDFQVVGNTLVFPEGNWFQVQHSSTFESVCNGELQCELAPGTYNVINHTLGQRFDNVVIGTPVAPEPSDDAPVVNGNIISWADDGWYQVQDSITFSSVCEGGRQCEVAAGTYQVINLTTGMRYENINVAGGEPVVPTEPPTPVVTPAGTYPSNMGIADANLMAFVELVESTLPEGASVAGDINGDGLDDLIVILEGEQTFQTSAAILFADAAGQYPDLPLAADLNTNATRLLTNGFVINDVSVNLTGVGDVNGDGYDDLSLQSSGFFTLATRVVLAGAASFPVRLSTADLTDAQLLVQLPISASLIKAGDINGDGIGDLFINQPSDVAGGVIYGATGLNAAFENRRALADLSLFPGCAGDFCITQPIGDFDSDGFDDVYVSRFGANNCGFSSYTVVLYGETGGITRMNDVTDYPASKVTRIVGARGASCFPKATSGISALGDVDGDGAVDIVLTTFYPDTGSHLIFGMSDQRRGFVSIDELDGQLGFNIPDIEGLQLDDMNNDGFDDVIFADGSGYAGFSRDISSIDAPVVRRTPSEFVINVPDSVLFGAARVAISVNDVSAGEFDASMADITVSDLTGGVEAVVAVSLVSSDDEVARTVRRVVPAYTSRENVEAALLAPRLIEITFNSDDAVSFYSHYLVWRNGVPIGRSLNGADNYIDADVSLGTTYVYTVTPDYLYDDSFNASLMRVSPLLQRESNSVTISTPEF